MHWNKKRKQRNIILKDKHSIIKKEKLNCFQPLLLPRTLAGWYVVLLVVWSGFKSQITVTTSSRKSSQENCFVLFQTFLQVRALCSPIKKKCWLNSETSSSVSVPTDPWYEISNIFFSFWFELFCWFWLASCFVRIWLRREKEKRFYEISMIIDQNAILEQVYLGKKKVFPRTETSL